MLFETEVIIDQIAIIYIIVFPVVIDILILSDIRPWVYPV